jgi:V/A-type H+-transporting ATPase subunit A
VSDVDNGRIVRINGPLVVADNMRNALMYEVVEVGEDRLIGEITRIEGDRAYIQVYEDTSGIKPGETVYRTGNLLSVELGPGLIGRIFDGLERPLDRIFERVKVPFVKRGVKVPSLERETKWHFVPKVKKGDKVTGGDIIGTVQETNLVEHKILVPPGISGEVKEVVAEGDYTVSDTILTLQSSGEEKELSMMHRWPARIPRPFKDKLEPREPLITGTRVLDALWQREEQRLSQVLSAAARQ